MNNIGKLTTFHQLLIDENTIIIPKVQRDYAYGRQEEKVAELLNDMLGGILQAIKIRIRTSLILYMEDHMFVKTKLLVV